MSEEILNDEKIIEELREKLSEHNAKLYGYNLKKAELNSTLLDLNGKICIQDISDATKEKIAEVMDKVKEKIAELDAVITDLNAKIKEIGETLSPAPSKSDETDKLNKTDYNTSKIAELKQKIKSKEEKRREYEQKIREKESERESPAQNGFFAQIDAQMRALEEQISRLNGTVENIDAKIGDNNINEATRERLEEMRDEVQDKIDEIDEKIDELRDKKDEYSDKICDEIDEFGDLIDELSDEIEELADEIEDIKTGTVDENIINQINEIKKSAGFNDLTNLLNKITDTVNAALSNVNIPDIVISKINPKINIKIPEQKPQPEDAVTLDDIIAIAPFAKKSTLDKLTDKLVITDDFEKLYALAPFLSRETLVKIVKRSGKTDMETLKVLAPFLGEDYIDKIISDMLV